MDYRDAAAKESGCEGKGERQPNEWLPRLRSYLKETHSVPRSGKAPAALAAAATALFGEVGEVPSLAVFAKRLMLYFPNVLE